jgi:hypothetical protein
LKQLGFAMAHGYAKVEGKPVLAMAHGTVGLQHTAMALYNAWCDRVPIYLVIGNTLDAEHRGGEVAWVHSVQDAGAMVRDFTKWNDTPASLQHFAESAVRAYKIAMTPPMMPVLLVADTELQDNAVPKGVALRIPKLSLAAPLAGDSGAVAEAAKMLVAAENPVIVACRAAAAPKACSLSSSANCDLVLALEPDDLYGTLRSVRQRRPLKLITITASDLYIRSNYQDFQRFNESDLPISRFAFNLHGSTVNLSIERHGFHSKQQAHLLTSDKSLCFRLNKLWNSFADWLAGNCLVRNRKLTGCMRRASVLTLA